LGEPLLDQLFDCSAQFGISGRLVEQPLLDGSSYRAFGLNMQYAESRPELLGLGLLANMRFSWWEATLLFVLWAVQFVFSGLEAPPPGAVGDNMFSQTVAGWIGVARPAVESFAHTLKVVMTWVYFGWAAVELGFVAAGRRTMAAFTTFPRLLREHW